MDREFEELLPGTEIVFSDREQNLRAADGSELKKDGDIILVPQPTDSPNDPLNWSAGRRYWLMTIVLFVTALTAATSNDSGAAQDSMNALLGIPWTAFNTSAGVLFIGIGYWTLLQAPTVYLYGRRIGYLVCMVFGVIGNVWFGFTKNSADAIWSQLFVGASEAVCEAQVQQSLMDVFFQHQSILAMSLYSALTSIGTFLGPLVGSYVSQNLGPEWVGKLGGIISGFAALLVYFGLEESYFDRKCLQRAVLWGTSRMGGVSGPKLLEANTDSNLDTLSTSSQQKSDGTPQVVEVAPEPRKSYWASIRLITPAPNLKGWGFKQFAKRLWLMLRVFCFPAVLHSGLQWGAQDAWLTFYMSVEEDNWANPPYNYGNDAQGIMNVPSLIGALIGCFYGLYVSEKIVHVLTKWNHGVQEAEYRLWAMLPAAIISPLGMFLFGAGTQHDWNWFPSYFALVLIGFGWGVCGDLSMTYLIEAYPDMVLEGMVGVSVINNTLGMIFSFACNPWMADMSVQNVMISIGVLDFVFIMSTVPMLIWGKRFRKMTKNLYFNFLEARDSLDIEM